jgi:hypothetical protein
MSPRRPRLCPGAPTRWDAEPAISPALRVTHEDPPDRLLGLERDLRGIKAGARPTSCTSAGRSTTLTTSHGGSADPDRGGCVAAMTVPAVGRPSGPGTRRRASARGSASEPQRAGMPASVPTTRHVPKQPDRCALVTVVRPVGRTLTGAEPPGRDKPELGYRSSPGSKL